MQTEIQAVSHALLQSEKTLVVTHLNPDGDAVGSASALAYIIKHLGADAKIYLPDGPPKAFDALPLPCPVEKTLEAVTQGGTWQPDLLAFVDCAEAHRAGPAMRDVMGGKPSPLPKGMATLNIDHHTKNPHFADVNWVEADRAATGELIGLLAEALEIPLTGGFGESVFLALSSDTGNFSYANTSESALAMASRIVKNGLDIGIYTDRYENIWTLERMHLWGKLMSEVQLHGNGAIAVSIVPLSYLDELELTKADLEGFASWLRKLDGVRVALFLREDAPGQTKVSMRSMGDINVQEVAALFGGGGHIAAAGAELDEAPVRAAELILPELESRVATLKG